MHAKAWFNLKDNMLREWGKLDTRKSILHDYVSVKFKNKQIGKGGGIIRTEDDFLDRGKDSTGKGHKEISQIDGNVLYLNSDT